MSSNPTQHKTAHNITTLTNIPLVAWLICSILALAGKDYEALTAWMSHPVNIVAGILFVVFTLKHFTLEIEVVFEDYIANVSLRNVIIIMMKIFFFVLGLTATISILKLGL